MKKISVSFLVLFLSHSAFAQNNQVIKNPVCPKGLKPFVHVESDQITYTKGCLKNGPQGWQFEGAIEKSEQDEKTISNYTYGKLNGPTKIYSVNTLSNHKTLISEQIYKDDVAEGPYKCYGAYGLVSTQGQFQNGKETGIWTTYNEHEVQTSRKTYIDGKMDGFYELDDATGVLTEKGFYANGTPAIQALYSEGTMKSIKYNSTNRIGQVLQFPDRSYQVAWINNVIMFLDKNYHHIVDISLTPPAIYTNDIALKNALESSDVIERLRADPFLFDNNIEKAAKKTESEKIWANTQYNLFNNGMVKIDKDLIIVAKPNHFEIKSPAQKINGTVVFTDLNGSVISTMKYDNGAYTGEGYFYSKINPKYFEGGSLYAKKVIQMLNNSPPTAKYTGPMWNRSFVGNYSFNYKLDDYLRKNGFGACRFHDLLTDEKKLEYKDDSGEHSSADFSKFYNDFFDGKYNYCFEKLAEHESPGIEERAQAPDWGASVYLQKYEGQTNSTQKKVFYRPTRWVPSIID